MAVFLTIVSSSLTGREALDNPRNRLESLDLQPIIERDFQKRLNSLRARASETSQDLDHRLKITKNLVPALEQKLEDWRNALSFLDGHKYSPEWFNDIRRMLTLPTVSEQGAKIGGFRSKTRVAILKEIKDLHEKIKDYKSKIENLDEQITNAILSDFVEIRKNSKDENGWEMIYDYGR
jgi:predicted  nucleic acid-binding Zn-ribbon protein